MVFPRAQVKSNRLNTAGDRSELSSKLEKKHSFSLSVVKLGVRQAEPVILKLSVAQLMK